MQENSSLPYVMYGYLALLFVGLPLYMQYGLDMIGDAKYFFFRNCTLICGGMLLLILLWEKVTGVAAKRSGTINKRSETISKWPELIIKMPERMGRRLKPLDVAVLAYSLTTTISYILSPYKETALWGYADWHMGWISQLLFCGIYFSCRFFYKETKMMWILVEIAVCIVMLIGVMNRFGMDPLGVYAGMEAGEWNRQYLLSTVGNNNWYAGYVNVLAGIFFAAMCREKGIQRILGGIGTALYYATTLTMGSMTGILAAIVISIFLMILSLDSRKELLQALEAVFLFPLMAVVLRGLSSITKRSITVPEKIEKVILYSRFWYVLLLAAGIGIIILGYREKRKKRDFLKSRNYRKKLLLAAGLILGLGILAGIGILEMVSPEELAVSVGETSVFSRLLQASNGRLALWKGTLEVFGDATVSQKIFGVGSDCYYHALYLQSDLGTAWMEKGILENAVYANAHNEWLNLLITGGLAGAAGYGLIFGTALHSLAKRINTENVSMAVFLCVVGYFVCSFFTFQQVMSTPFLFAVLGMTEAGKDENIVVTLSL